MFFGRAKELFELNKLYATDNFQFAVVYGRRRIGKTALISEFIKDKKAIHYF
ncbi:MAG: ATP-binding protein [Lachnospiraceae bacterium]